MFKFQKFFSFSQILFSNICLQCSLKFNRTLYNSFLIGGCCFSKSSDEEMLVVDSRPKTQYNISSKNIKIEIPGSSSKLENPVSSSNNMKRSFESINDLQNVVSGQSAAQESDNKRKKTDFSETTDKLAQIQQSIKQLPIGDCTKEPFTIDKTDFKTEEEKPKKLRPNYFVAIKISDDQIHQELKELQAHILQKDERMKKSMIELKTLHITLLVMHIGDPETHARAVETLENIHREYDEEMSKNPMLLKFQGLGHFQNRVLYAKLVEDEGYIQLRKLAESVKSYYASASIFSTDSRESFTPHLTVAKIDFKKRQNRVIKKIDPSFHKEFKNQYFGTQKVEGIQLLSMLDPKTETGYYSGKDIYFSAFEPSVQRDSLSKLLEIEEKKKSVREMINAAIKKKLK